MHMSSVTISIKTPSIGVPKKVFLQGGHREKYALLKGT